MLAIDKSCAMKEWAIFCVVFSCLCKMLFSFCLVYEVWIRDYICSQVVAGSNQDHLTISVAEDLERAFGGWVCPTQVLWLGAEFAPPKCCDAKTTPPTNVLWWKHGTHQTLAVREIRYHGGPIDHGTVVFRGLREILNWSPIMPRDASLSDSK